VRKIFKRKRLAGVSRNRVATENGTAQRKKQKPRTGSNSEAPGEPEGNEGYLGERKKPLSLEGVKKETLPKRTDRKIDEEETSEFKSLDQTHQRGTIQEMRGREGGPGRSQQKKRSHLRQSATSQGHYLPAWGQGQVTRDRVLSNYITTRRKGSTPTESIQNRTRSILPQYIKFSPLGARGEKLWIIEVIQQKGHITKGKAPKRKKKREIQEFRLTPSEKDREGQTAIPPKMPAAKENRIRTRENERPILRGTTPWSKTTSFHGERLH